MITNNQTTLHCLRFPQVRAKVGLSRATIWRLERLGQFPKRRQISPRTVAWICEEVDSWLEQRAKVHLFGEDHAK